MGIRTLINDPFEDDAVSMLEWAYGLPAKYRFIEFVAGHQRAGQAFMNVLSEFDPTEYTASRTLSSTRSTGTRRSPPLSTSSPVSD